MRFRFLILDFRFFLPSLHSLVYSRLLWLLDVFDFNCCTFKTSSGLFQVQKLSEILFWKHLEFNIFTLKMSVRSLKLISILGKI